LKSSPGDVLLDEHKRLEGQTKTGLSRAAAKGAETLGDMTGTDVLGNSNKMRDLTAAAARVLGWDKAPQTNVQVNTLRITAEQLEEIRAVRDVEGLP
jgi:hypothetical protein